MKHARISPWLATSLAIGLAACSPTRSLQPDSPGPQVRSDGTCRTDQVAWAIGQPANEQVFARVWRESGAGLIRPIAPGQAVTRDIKSDRINVRVDANNIITALDCG
ncbi:MAG TPA: I78 family peptidase inhibitor [Stenotrophomonas sp.]|jgi:hypothetical protein